MTEINEGRSLPLKGDMGGYFSDADSGFDDPGVITIPVVRTVIHNSEGIKFPTASTELVSILRGREKDYPRLQSVNNLHNSSSPSSLESCQTVIDRVDEDLSLRGDFDHSPDSSGSLNKQISSTELNFTMFSSDIGDINVSKFHDECNLDDDSERRLRFLSAPRDKRGRPMPIMRDICTSNNSPLKERTTKRIPRKRFRSKSADEKRNKGPQTLFSPTYSKVLSPETMKKRKIWTDVLKRDCILEEEYYKVPYEECNKEVILGRFCSPETLLYNFRRLKKQRSSDIIGDHKLTINENKCQPNIEFTGDSTNNTYTKKNDDEIYAKNLCNPIEKIEPLELFKWKEDFKTPLLFPKNPSTTDQIQQLIDDLNQIAFSHVKSDFEKDNNTNTNKYGRKYVPISSRHEDLKDFNDNITDSFNTEIPNFSCKDQKDDIKPMLQQEKKMKIKKKVSFSNENEEVVFDSNFSDSESSVFEDKNEFNIVSRNSDLNPKEYGLHKMPDLQKPYHDLSLMNTDTSKVKKLLISSGEINKYNVNSENYDGRYKTSNVKSPKTRYDEPFALPGVAYSLDPHIFHSLTSDDEYENLNRYFRYGENGVVKKDLPVNKKPSQPTQPFPFYNNLPQISTKENVNRVKKKTNLDGNLRRDKVNIFMTKGPSFSDQEILFSTCKSSLNPKVSVSRIRVPISNIQDQWQWAKYIEHQGRKSKEMSQPNDFPKVCNSPSPLENKVAPSPTPSCESETSLSENSSTTSGCSPDFYSPPLSPFPKNKGALPTSL